tara:strand:- start:137 stop:1666 length:1530 start_codon:yes stop_codon:yes gene_type:complete
MNPAAPLIRTVDALKLLIVLCLTIFAPATLANNASHHFESVKKNPVKLRQFLQQFPKGGDLHNHLSGAIYAESYLAWAREDGKCIDLNTHIITPPPCERAVSLKEVMADASSTPLEPIIDALSVRNYERRSISGHDQFFATFNRFRSAAIGRFGDMVAEARRRAGRQNMVYLELMVSLGMLEVAQLAAQNGQLDAPFGERISHSEVDALVDAVIKQLDAIEARQNQLLGCDTSAAITPTGCDVTVRFQAQVLRTFAPVQVYAQTLLAVKLVQADHRVVGLNFVAPEDHRIARRDYRQHMQFIAELSAEFPSQPAGITLHAGELTLGLVPPEDLGWHIRDAIETAGATRIGHGIDIAYDDNMDALLNSMAEQDVMVEINLTSNDVILGIKDAAHPLPTYLDYGVPVTLSTDDEGVSRIDLTHEYQRAATTYDLSYSQLREFARNSLQYSFLPGARLFDNTADGQAIAACATEVLGSQNTTGACAEFLAASPKAKLQWELEKRLSAFEANF